MGVRLLRLCLCLKDDIALHDDLTRAEARDAILYGMDLARERGIVSFGGAYLENCAHDEAVWLKGIAVTRCAHLGSHAYGVTRSRAATLMQVSRASR